METTKMMRDARGVPFKPDCTVAYLDTEGRIAWSTVTQVIELTGELVVRSFSLPMSAIDFFVLPPRPPEVVVREALINLLASPLALALDEMGSFVRLVNETLAPTPLWVRRTFVSCGQGSQGSICFVNRTNHMRSGFFNQGVGLEWPEGVFRLRDEREVFYDQDLTDHEFILHTIMCWVTQCLESCGG